MSTAITPAGEEFFQHVFRLRDQISRERDRLRDESSRSLVRALRKMLTCLNEETRLKEALSGLIEGATAEFNEKGAGGFALARLSDARNVVTPNKDTRNERSTLTC
jgi:hypothetical protein